MAKESRAETENWELTGFSRFSIQFLRRLLSGRRAENLIQRLGISDLRSLFYLALQRTSISYHGPNELIKRSISYYEFGVGWGYTLSRYLEALTAYCLDFAQDSRFQKILLFDSFEGLPEKRMPQDDHAEWASGMFAHGVPEIKKVIDAHGFDPESDNFKFVKGFFEKSLTMELAESCRRIPPDIITIDVDYYSSTKTVLDWLRPLLRSGCMFFFDDIWSFDGSPTKGELGALNDFNRGGEGKLVPFDIVPTMPNLFYIYTPG